MHSEEFHDSGLQQISVGLTNDELVGQGTNTHTQNIRNAYQVWLENILICRGIRLEYNIKFELQWY
jgi:hypothetical protein